MKAEVFRDLSRDELEAKSRELREQLLKLRFQKSTGQIENPQMLRSVRKDIARVMTILREKQIARGAGAAPADAGAATAGSAEASEGTS